MQEPEFHIELLAVTSMDTKRLVTAFKEAGGGILGTQKLKMDAYIALLSKFQAGKNISDNEAWMTKNGALRHLSMSLLYGSNDGKLLANLQNIARFDVTKHGEMAIITSSLNQWFLAYLSDFNTPFCKELLKVLNTLGLQKIRNEQRLL